MTPDKTITVSFDPPTEENWDSYMAVPTTEAALHVVRALAIVPTVNGGVQFELHVNGHEIEIEFDEHGLLESTWVGTTAKRLCIHPRDIGGGAAGSSARSTGSLGTRESLDKRAALAASPRVSS